jgi:hypothetical protein
VSFRPGPLAYKGAGPTLAIVALAAELGDLLPELAVVLVEARTVVHVLDVSELVAEDREQPARRKEAAVRPAEDELDDLARTPVAAGKDA